MNVVSSQKMSTAGSNDGEGDEQPRVGKEQATDYLQMLNQLQVSRAGPNHPKICKGRTDISFYL